MRPGVVLAMLAPPATKPIAVQKPRRLLDVATFFKELCFEHDLRDEEAAILTRAAARHVARDLPIPDLVYSRRVSEVGSPSFSFLSVGGCYPDLHEMRQAAMDAAGKSDVVLVRMVPTPAEDPYLAKWVKHIRLEDPAAHAKLAKMSFADMCGVAQRFQWSLHRKGEKATRHHLRSCPVVHRYEDGWSWVWLETDEQRDAEGKVMRHCVGDGTYDDPAPDCGLFSLRDPKGQPTVTAQIRSGCLAHHETGTGAPHSRVPEPRLLELAKRCGLHMSLHGRPGWATDEEIAAEEAGRRNRKRVELREGLANEEHRLASHLAEASADPATKDRRELFEMALRRSVYARRLDLAELDGLPKPEKDPVLVAFEERRRAQAKEMWGDGFSVVDAAAFFNDGRPPRFYTYEFWQDVPPRLEIPRPDRRRAERVALRPRRQADDHEELVEVSEIWSNADPGGNEVLTDFSFEARAVSPMLRGVLGFDVQPASTCQLDRMRDERLNDLQAQMEETEAQVLKPPRIGFDWMTRTLSHVADFIQSATPYHLQDRNPRSAQQARRMGART